MNRVLLVYLEAKTRRRIFVHCRETGTNGEHVTSEKKIASAKELPEGPAINDISIETLETRTCRTSSSSSAATTDRATESFFVDLLEQAFEQKLVTCDDVREWRDTEFQGNIVHFLAIQNDVPGLLYVINLCGADPYLQRPRDGVSPLHLAAMLSSRREAAEFLQTLPGYTFREFRDHEGRTVGECRKLAEAGAERKGAFAVFDLIFSDSRPGPLEVACIILDDKMQEVSRFSRCLLFSSISEIEEFSVEERVEFAKDRLLEDCFDPKTALSVPELEDELFHFLAKFCSTKKDASAFGFGCRLVAWNPWKVYSYLEQSMPRTLAYLSRDWVSVYSFRNLVRSCGKDAPPVSVYFISKSRALKNCLLTLVYLQSLQDSIKQDRQSMYGDSPSQEGTVKNKKQRERRRTWREWKEEKPCYIC